MHPTKSASLLYALCAIAPIGIWAILISSSFTISDPSIKDVQELFKYLLADTSNKKIFIWLILLPIYLLSVSIIYLTPLAQQRRW